MDALILSKSADDQPPTPTIDARHADAGLTEYESLVTNSAVRPFFIVKNTSR
jgi:hypothetical protein